MMVRPIIKAIQGVGEVPELFTPKSPTYFGIKLYLYIGPNDCLTEELFQITVCSPSWFADHGMYEKFQMGSGRLFCETWNWAEVQSYLSDYVESCADETWPKTGMRIARLADWEMSNEVIARIQ